MQPDHQNVHLVSFSPYWHLPFEILGYAASSFLFRGELTRGFTTTATQNRNYWLSLVTGAVLGAYLFGSLNLSLEGLLRIGHSIAGALAGAIVGVELHKLRQGQFRSTGAIFVLPVTCGIAVGRIGCFLAGLKDETYGVVTQLPWGVDLGDGLSRHPVALYESLSLAIFAMAIALWRRNRMTTYREFAFYIFIVFYAAQRFAWEFLKPYKTVVGPLNTFHLVCLAMIAYALTMMWRVHAHDRRRSTD